MKKVLSALLISVMALISTSICAMADSPKSEILYLNDNIMTSNKDIMENATYQKNVASVSNLYEDKVFFEDGKFYGIECEQPKSVIQKINTKRNFDSSISEDYVADIIVSGNLVTYDVDEDVAQNFENDTYYSRAAIESITREKTTSDASVMKIRYTVYFKSINVNGATAIALSHSYGKVVYCETGSGVMPERMVFYSRIGTTKVYNENGGFLGTYGLSAKTQTVNNPSIGESAAYLYNINNFNEFFDVDGDAVLAGTNLTVYATRGVTLQVNVDLSNE